MPQRMNGIGTIANQAIPGASSTKLTLTAMTRVKKVNQLSGPRFQKALKLVNVVWRSRLDGYGITEDKECVIGEGSFS